MDQMHYETSINEHMSLKDMLMTVTEEQVEEVLLKVLDQKNTNDDVVDRIINSILDSLSISNKGVLIDKVEFETIRSILESKIPKNEEMEVGTGIEPFKSNQFSLNLLDGDPKALRETIKTIHHSLVGDDPDNFFASNSLREAFSRAETPHQLQQVLFIKNYNDLALDVREQINMLIKKGIKVYILRSDTEQLPSNGFVNLSQNLQESQFLSYQKRLASQFEEADQDLAALN